MKNMKNNQCNNYYINFITLVKYSLNYFVYFFLPIFIYLSFILIN